MTKHYKNEAGTQLLLDTGIAIGTATDFAVYYRKPNGAATGSWVASAFSSYSNNVGLIGTYFVSYSLTSTDLDTPGGWKFQAWIGHSSGTWWGETVDFQVFDQYE